MKYLGIDYGQSHIGLALSNGFLAEPYENIKYQISNIKNQNQSLKIIKNIVTGEKIDKIIIGISEGKMAGKTKKFGEVLKKITGLPVEYYDETLTSQEAVRKMIEAGKRKKTRKEREHNIAACLILQGYLDSRI